MYATGCVDITHLMVIAVDRMLAITSPIKYKALGGSKAATIGAILFSWAYGTLWAILPLFGESYSPYTSIWTELVLEHWCNQIILCSHDTESS